MRVSENLLASFLESGEVMRHLTLLRMLRMVGELAEAQACIHVLGEAEEGIARLRSGVDSQSLTSS